MLKVQIGRDYRAIMRSLVRARWPRCALTGRPKWKTMEEIALFRRSV